MKTKSKSFLALCLTLALVFGLLPEAATAANGDTVSDLTGLQAQMDGSNKLLYDIKIDTTINIDSNFTLDLNGHTITYISTSGRVFEISNTGSMNLTDSASGGVITGAQSMGAIRVDGGTFSMSGGSISGNHSYQNGGGVSVVNGGTFELFQGSISNNTARAGGGGVFVSSGGTFHGYDCTISDNSTTNNGGGGIELYDEANCEIERGDISGNRSNLGYGGGIFIKNSTLNIQSVRIEGNFAATGGGGVDISLGGTFHMNASSITNNTSNGDGGGVWFSGNPNNSFTIEGLININHNTVNNLENNVYLAQDKTINILSDLSDSSQIGVSCALPSTGTDKIVIATGANNDFAKFFSDESSQPETDYIIAETMDHNLILTRRGRLEINNEVTGDLSPAELEGKEFSFELRNLDIIGGAGFYAADGETITFEDGIAVVTITGSSTNDFYVPIGEYGVTIIRVPEFTGYDFETDQPQVIHAIVIPDETVSFRFHTAYTKLPEISMTANVVWAGDDEASRPDSVTVRLCRDGELFGDPFPLSASNSWSYTWDGLDTSYTWSVREDPVPDGYTSSVTESADGTVTITNTKIPAAPPVPDPVPTPPPSDSGGSGSDRDRTPSRTTTTPAAEILPFPEVVKPPRTDPGSPWQELLKEEQTPVPWVERIDTPAYARDLYDVLVSGSDPAAPYGETFADCLLEDANFRLDPNAPGGTASCQIDGAEAITFTLLDPYADVSLEGLDSMIFASDDFFQVGTASSDQAVNYAALKLGEVVKTANFNGIFVTSLPRGANYEQDKQDVAAMIATVFQAFDRDHPEVFWLSGKCRVRTISTTAPGGSKTAYFFLTLADKDGFTMRSSAWSASGAVADGLRRRDAAVDKILASVTAATPYEQVRQLNKWLTEHNEYNTTPDLTTIGNEPHECLSALEGRTGTSGPVCDGYSRAFKVLCGKLGISCILENGYAKPTAQSGGTFHMWNSVQMDGRWFGMDVTWNDPSVKGVSGAKSGKENENYLLVGASTAVRGMTFSASHPATNQAITAGVAFTNRPALSPIAYSAISADADPAVPGKPFQDVSDSAPYAQAVYAVYGRDLMSGTSATTFSPSANLSRQQIWMMLARLSGQRPAGMTAARGWAVDGAISDGSNPGANVSRQQLAALLYRNAQSRGLDVTAPENALDGLADASSAASYAVEPLRWAVANGILTGTNGALSPEAPATRAQAAVSFARFCEYYKL